MSTTRSLRLSTRTEPGRCANCGPAPGRQPPKRPAATLQRTMGNRTLARLLHSDRRRETP